jgi:hypothetical protein
MINKSGYKTDDPHILTTIPGHKGQVNCVQFPRSIPNYLLSGDDQGWLYVHYKQEENVTFRHSSLHNNVSNRDMTSG